MSELHSEFFAERGFIQDKNARSLSFFAKDASVAFDDDVAEELLRVSQEAGNVNARVCLHQSPEDLFHEMIILEYRKGRYYRPHRHKDKGESCHVIKGKVLVLTFDDSGNVDNSFVLEEGKPGVSRVGNAEWHTVIPLTSSVMYHEAKLGPFLGTEDSIYPEWAPDGSDSKVAESYINELVQALGYQFT